MPVMSGQVMIHKMRKFEKRLNIKKGIGIIVTTGDPSENEQMRCLNLGANEFLSKPIRMKQLGESLKRVLAIPNQELKINPTSDKTILIIDDDKFCCDIIKRYFMHTYHVLTASSQFQVIIFYSY
jgi:FixJ family two-component response regulator